MQHKEKDIQIFKTELEFFSKMHKDWLKTHENQYALIKGKKLIAAFLTLEEAYSAGIEHFGDDVFFVKQIVKEEPPEQFASYFANAVHVFL